MDLTVGLAGSGADRIVSGTADDEINQALADVGAAGGGSVVLLQGTFTLDTGIVIDHDNVTLQGAGAGQSILQTTAAYSDLSPIVMAYQADNVAIQGIGVDGHTNNTTANGIQTVQCTNAVITECEVKLSENHNYAIWLVLSDGVQVLDNYIDGVTPTAGQEGIESWSSDNVLISGNTMENLGGAGIGVGSLPSPAFGDIAGQNTNIKILNNTVNYAYIGASIAVGGPRSFGQIEVQGNTFTDIAFGVRLVIDKLPEYPGDPQSLHDIDISNNQINLNAQSGFGMLLLNNYSPGVVSFSNISAYDNKISNAPGEIFGITDFDHFTLDGNIITGTAEQVSGSPYDDIILGSNLADVFSGEDGADTFMYDLTAFTPGSGVVDRVLDYNQGGGVFDPAEGDSFDFSALLSAGAGQPIDNLVRVLRNPGGAGAILQIDQDGSANGAQWTTIARLDGVVAGDDITVIFDDSQPAATLTAPANRVPVVTALQANTTTTTAQSLAVSSLFSASDDDGDPLTYYLYDGNGAAGSGHFVVNGVTVAALTEYEVTAAQFAQTVFVAGARDTADDISVRVFDGTDYSSGTTGVHVAVRNSAPQVSLPAGTDVSTTAAQTFQVSSLFSGSDADGDALTYYLYDGNSAANSGRFVVGGTIVPAQTIYALTAAQLAQATYVAGATGTSDDIYVQTFDGQLYSGWNAGVHVAVPNHAPQVSLPAGANVSMTAAQTFQVSSLFRGSDADDDALTYYLYDGNSAANSGRFVVGGSIVPAQTIYALTAAQLAQATYVAGAAGTVDDIYV